jgi:hypothetical protein
MTTPHSHIPIEFRLALGASCAHDSFDGTAILNLCDDPWVTLDRGGNLVGTGPTVHDGLDSIFAPRVGASKTTPQELFRTGYGVRLAWDITIKVGTSRLGFLPSDAPPRPEINDGSLWHLASLLSLTAGSTDSSDSAFPPYLYLTTNYQHYLEQWIAVELDPSGSSSGASGIEPIEFDPATKTATRTLHLRLVSKQNYKKILPAYFPSLRVAELDITVTSLPKLTADFGGFYAQVQLSGPLPAHLGLLDGLLLNLGNTLYGWKLFIIKSLDSDDRMRLTLVTATDMAGEFLAPPAAPLAMRSAVQNNQVYLPTYCLTPFVGTMPPVGQIPLTGAYLLGNPYDFCITQAQATEFMRIVGLGRFVFSGG